MNILLLSTHIDIGGVGRYVANLAVVLHRRGHNVFVASSGGRLENVLNQAGIGHILIGIKTKSELSPKIIKSFFTLKPFLIEKKIDVMHAHTRVTQVLSQLLSAYQKIPYVMTCHGFFKNRLGRKIAGCWGKRVIAISRAVKGHLLRDFRVREEKIALIHTGIDMQKFLRGFTEEEKRRIRNKWNIKNEMVIGAVGRLSPVKGQAVLIKAVNKIIEGYPNIKVLLIGAGPDEGSLKQLSRGLGLDKHVVFTGSLDDTREALSIIDIFAQPSIKEGLGLSLIEAMACGRPCIASRIGGIEDMIEDGINGVLVKPGDPEDLARAIKYMLANRRVGEAYGNEARKSVVDRFTMDRMASQVEKVYEEAAAVQGSKGQRKKILIFNVNWLGDILFTSPFIRAVREAFPESYIACVAPPRCKEILEANTRINEVVSYDEGGRERSLLGKLRFAFKLRRERFDTAFILHRSLTRALITLIAGIGERVGYDTKGRSAILTTKLRLPEKPAHRVEHFLKLARAVGINTPKKDYEFFITSADRKKADSILKAAGVNSNDRLVALNPGGNWNPKRWPTDRFAELADKLVKKYGVTILITGAEKDKALAGEISANMKSKAISICGRTGIRELASIFGRTELLISGDSGPMHIAISMGASVVALYGPTSAGITGPYGKGNYVVIEKDIGCDIPCYDSMCSDNLCMKAHSADEVLKVIEERKFIKCKVQNAKCKGTVL